MKRCYSTAKEALRLSKPVLELLEGNSAQNEGVKGLFSQKTVTDVWYQQVDKYTEDLEFGIEESINANFKSIVSKKSSSLAQYHEMMKESALDPRDSLAFNSASALYNLTHFFSSLKNNHTTEISVPARSALLSTPNYAAIAQATPLDRDLLEKISKSFGSVEEFVTLFMASASALQGNGYTWLVLRVITSEQSSTDFFKNTASMAIVNTYNNGTPTELTSGQVSAMREHMSNKVFNRKENDTDKILSIEEAQEIKPIDLIGFPLFGIPSNPAFYLRDYGVFGKRQYLENSLRCVDWNVVNARFKSHMTSK